MTDDQEPRQPAAEDAPAQEAPEMAETDVATAASEPDANGRAAASFDPTPYLRQLRGRGGAQDYLDVKWRLLWLRREHPAAELVTEHVRIDETIAIFKATVTLPTGGKATGYGSETAADFGDFIEKAETKAIGRALNALGYGAQFAEEAEENGPRAVAPTPRPGAEPAAPAPREAPPAAVARPDRAARPTPPATPAAPPIDIAAGRERVAAQPTARTEPVAAKPAARPTGRGTPPASDEPNMADYTPTAFWRWAREQGLDRAGVERLIGRQVTGLTPSELRRLVLEAQGES